LPAEQPSSGKMPETLWGNKKPLLAGEEVKNDSGSSHFPRHELRAGFGTSIELASNRLPWRLRASPSATLHETVISTDADTLISNGYAVNLVFGALVSDPAR